MRKPRKKSRVESVSLELLNGAKDSYYLVVPHDKKGRAIPSSVVCVYNSSYYSDQEAVQMALAL